jgi:2-amino-4-hydroxy-6-hydroxymethyldihydropteridine diphosphokinase
LPVTLPSTAAIALGSNLGDRAGHISSALRALGDLPGTSLVACSSLYETAPVGPVPQGPFLNAAAVLSTSLTPRELLSALQSIERLRGRDRSSGQRWGPRTLDLDLLVYGQTVLDEPGLTLPHPRLHERAFVLVPLAEIAPNLPIPASAGRPATTPARALEELRRAGHAGAEACTLLVP